MKTKTFPIRQITILSVATTWRSPGSQGAVSADRERSPLPCTEPQAGRGAHDDLLLHELSSTVTAETKP